MKNVFLDANIVYKDPFFLKSFPLKLLKYAEHNVINIYLPTVVFNEILNNYEKELQKVYSQYKSSIKSINDLLDTETIQVDNLNIEEKLDELKTFYMKLVESKNIILVDYSNDLLPKILDRSINNIRPFQKNKSEFRDAMIWLSCLYYINENKLIDNILLSNNTKDFYNDEKTELHDDFLSECSTITGYTSIQGFFDDYDYELIDKYHQSILEKFIEDESIDENYVEDLLNRNFSKNINEKFINFSSNIEPSTLNQDIFTGYVDPDLHADILDVFDLEIDTNFSNDLLIISGTVQVSSNVELYQYNSVYDSYDEKYQYISSEEIILDIGFDFQYDLNCYASNIDISYVGIA